MNPPPSNTRFIVAMITLLGLSCTILGALLLYKGFQGGEIFAVAGTGAISGLLGMLKNTPPSPPTP